jgi:hypothetical protein
MIAYLNRFGDVTEKAAYRLEHFDDVQRWHISGTTLPFGPSGNDDEESDVDVGQDPNDDDNISKRVNRVKKAYESHHLAKLSLACHVEMYKGIPDLIKDTSAEFGHVKEDVHRRLNLLKERLEWCSKHQGAPNIKVPKPSSTAWLRSTCPLFTRTPWLR